MALFGLGLFASLSVAFPLVGIWSDWALQLSGIGVALALTPAFPHRQGVTWKWAACGVGAAVAAFTLGLWWVREWIPPTPLYLSQATFAKAVDSLEPIEPVTQLSVEDLRRWGRLVAFTAVASPPGVHEPVHHVWRKDGQSVSRMPLTEIRGGRPGGYRTYSWKTDFGSDPAGLWSVEVRTSDDRLVGRTYLRVVIPEPASLLAARIHSRTRGSVGGLRGAASRHRGDKASGSWRARSSTVMIPRRRSAL